MIYFWTEVYYMAEMRVDNSSVALKKLDVCVALLAFLILMLICLKHVYI